MRPSDQLDFVRFAGNARDIALAIDAKGTILAASKSVKALLGYDVDMQIGKNVVDFVHPDDIMLAIGLLDDVEGRPGTTESFDVRVAHHDGRYVSFEILPLNLFDTEGIVVLTGRDNTERLETQRARDQEELRFRAIAESAPIAIFRLDSDGMCEFVNDRWTALTGQARSAALGLGWINVVAHRDQIKLVAIRDSDGRVQTTRSGELELTLHSNGGEQRSVIGRWTAMHSADGEDIGFIGTMEDVTERKALEARLLHQATHDALTGLPNRVILNEHLTKFLALGARAATQVAVAFCDLDRFKIVNDSLGHEIGDRLLTAVARRFTTQLRSSDVVARFGGDEFVIVAMANGPDEIRELTSRLHAVFAEPFEIGVGRPYRCTGSIGIATSEPGSTAETLLRDADVAMYRAKEQGRGRSEQFDYQLREKALDRLNLMSALPFAIANNELRVHYQPILRTSDRTISAVEALIRWQHPTRGMLAPDSFVEAAEESRLILDFGDWVLERACLDLLRVPNVKLNVNLSAYQVHDPGLVSRVSQSLERTGFPPERLVLEITESVLVSDIETSIETLRKLKELGLAIAVDDFGTGYSSLNYLSRFPVDCLKIDRSFIQSLGSSIARSSTHSNDNEIVRSVIALAHALRMTATAEGVETERQLEQLADLHCDQAQGYLFQEPVDIDTFLAMWVDRASV